MMEWTGISLFITKVEHSRAAASEPVLQTLAALFAYINVKITERYKKRPAAIPAGLPVHQWKRAVLLIWMWGPSTRQS
jgi:hypothetical protein